LSAVGFGDITVASQSARLVVPVQTLLDLRAVSGSVHAPGTRCNRIVRAQRAPMRRPSPSLVISVSLIHRRGMCRLARKLARVRFGLALRR